MSAALYQTTHIAKSNEFVFVTESGQTYRVYFDKKAPIFPLEELDEHAIYMGFSCTPKQVKFDRNHDAKIGNTIMWIIANMFASNKRYIITYVCSPEDGQERQRSITFGKWYNESNLSQKIRLERKNYDGTYCGVLCSKKHPLLEELDIALEDFNPNNKFAEPEIEYGMEDDELSEGGFDEEINF